MDELLTQKPLLDSGQLLQYSGGDPDLANELLGDFLTLARDYVGQLGKAGTVAEWSDGTHRIKGAAQGIGAAKLALLATMAEADCASVDAWPSYLQRMAAALDELSAVRAHMD